MMGKVELFFLNKDYKIGAATFLVLSNNIHMPIIRNVNYLNVLMTVRLEYFTFLSE